VDVRQNLGKLVDICQSGKFYSGTVSDFWFSSLLLKFRVRPQKFLKANICETTKQVYFYKHMPLSLPYPTYGVISESRTRELV